MKRGDEHEVLAGELGHGGDARVSTPQGTVYVPGVFPGERVRLLVEGGKKPSARLLEVLEPSPARREPPCPIARRCGGCSLMALAEAEASLQKRAMLARAAGTDAVRWIEPESPLRYRRRARLHFDASRSRVGYRAKRSHELVPVASCLVLTEALDVSITWLGEVLEALEGKGEIAVSETLDGISMVFESGRAQPPSAYRALEALSTRQEVSSVALRVPGSPVPSVFGRATERHRGPDGLPLETPLGGFVQANAAINERLASLVAEWAAARGKKAVELFAGSGNLSVLLARDASTLVTVEGYSEAVSLAEKNLRNRGLSAHLVAEDVERAKLPRADVLVLDPPRRGFPELSRALSSVRPERVVLVSCDLGSLGRELATLGNAGYEVDEVAGFDMFPQTPHLEALVRLHAT